MFIAAIARCPLISWLFVPRTFHVCGSLFRRSALSATFAADVVARVLSFEDE
jgi:hypothetical protein